MYIVLNRFYIYAYIKKSIKQTPVIIMRFEIFVDSQLLSVSYFCSSLCLSAAVNGTFHQRARVGSVSKGEDTPLPVEPMGDRKIWMGFNGEKVIISGPRLYIYLYMDLNDNFSFQEFDRLLCNCSDKGCRENTMRKTTYRLMSRMWRHIRLITLSHSDSVPINQTKMPVCFVPECTHSSRYGCSFFRFPSYVKTRNLRQSPHRHN